MSTKIACPFCGNPDDVCCNWGGKKDRNPRVQRCGRKVKENGRTCKRRAGHDGRCVGWYAEAEDLDTGTPPHLTVDALHASVERAADLATSPVVAERIREQAKNLPPRFTPAERAEILAKWRAAFPELARLLDAVAPATGTGRLKVNAPIPVPSTMTDLGGGLYAVRPDALIIDDPINNPPHSDECAAEIDKLADLGVTPRCTCARGRL